MLKLNNEEINIIKLAAKVGAVQITTNDKMTCVIAKDKNDTMTFLALLNSKESDLSEKKYILDENAIHIINSTIESIELEKIDDKVNIKSQFINSVIKEPEKSYTYEEEKITGIAVINLDICKRVLYSAASENSQLPVLEGVNFKFEDELNLYATNGSRGSSISDRYTVLQGEVKDDFTIDKTDLKKILTIMEGEVTICISEKRVSFIAGSITIVVNKINSKYINYNQIINAVRADSAKITLKKSLLIWAIQTCPISEEKSLTLTVDDRVCISSKNIVSNSEIFIPNDKVVKSGTAKISFSPTYMLEMLNSTTLEEITIDIGAIEEARNLVFKIKEKNYSAFTFGVINIKSSKTNATVEK